ncbi:GNAT family N-acetyltransferase [Nocardioides sp. SR21]|uniref:GNAT family N-acetyltransferase n=1 Tax=Nocardioides sp. SR21 TaxID=2919501 RepID=UPI001FAB105A|nr:GNAT family N-acetyltransferase [Nocardioides sp. SR21]
MQLTVVPVTDATAGAWAEIHNRIIPADPLSEDDVRERMTRNELTLAYDGDVLVGNATLRPPAGEERIATVIVRILPEHRGRGLGTEYYDAVLERVAELEPERIETVVLAANEGGLRFAENLGFEEHDRYMLDGTSPEWVDLHLA